MSIIEEAGLSPDRWQIAGAPAIRPGAQFQQAPPPPNSMGNYFQGSISPSLQHDAVFVGTEYGTPRIPSVALMPVGLSGNSSFNSGITSHTSTTPIPTPTPKPTPVVDVQLFQVNGNPDLLSVGLINGVPA